MRESNEGTGRRAAPRDAAPRNMVDEMIEETFPASDAPGWGPLVIGGPVETPPPDDGEPGKRDAPEPHGDR